MAKRNSSGPGRGRKTSSGSRSTSSRKRSDDSQDRPFKKSKDEGFGAKKRSGFSDRSSSRSSSAKSFGKSDERKPRFRKDEDTPGPKRKSFGKSSDRDERSARPFAKRDAKPFERKSRFSKGDDSSGPKRKSFSKSNDRNERSSRPFPKRDGDSFDSKPRFRKDEGSGPRKSFGKSSDRDERSSRPFAKRDGDSFERKPPFRKDEGSGPRKSFGKSGDRDERSSRPFAKRSDKPFDRKPRFKDEDESGAKRSFSKRGDGDSDHKSRFKKESTGFSSSRSKFGSKDDNFKKGKGKSFNAEPPDYNAKAPAQTGQMRLNRFIANSGLCSRREADEFITMGLISVNGKVITELGYKVNPDDEVRHENRVLRAEKPVYVLMNKPKGYLTTTVDPQERNTVMHILGNSIKERIYPVGRLDRNTTGLLLLTNDGDLADKLMHPSYNVKKIYKVELDRPLTKADFQRLQEGVQLEEGRAQVDDAAIVSEDGKTVGIEIHIGWNRVVRRIFEALEYEVVKLDRSVYAGLDKKDLPRGHWRHLRKEEIVRLKHYK